MFKQIQKARKNQKGFTLVELMVVVVIIGILVAIAVPIYNTTMTRAQDRADDANIRVLNGAVAAYVASEDNAAYSDFDGISIAHNTAGSTSPGTVTGTFPTGWTNYLETAPNPSRAGVTYTFSGTSFSK
ncbi:prepilin-type N-terminal cleavage/methylation domain-containing protein [Dethiobacter alkaliphilus]|uniref:Prepilin-type N-terminal cleavage/methylation domain-containing protein n=1 Tax=Dethiobacter alkaliphilus AHT 1 TaxID=555088 RepID=C0GE63_DETAL|nr:prepilin-type N-terminal cleavage/methylation domain-containing protein [Dethiobacter alkaliphilus]EEG78357.1 hypothetical protein DealDRAFT_0772 [Dethiobacter alkaliphilus AHT 1]